MDEIRITAAEELPEELYKAWENWRAEAEKLLHSGRIQWYAKSVSTIFEMNGKRYKILPSDLFSPETVKEYRENFLKGGKKK